jgi:hypothetical protein
MSSHRLRLHTPRLRLLLLPARPSPRSPTCGAYFKCPAYDPEGSLGALTASFMAFEGLLAGRASHHVHDESSCP